MTKKQITNEDLARMVKGGFDDVDEGFKKVDKRFDDVDKRFDKVDKRFDKVDVRLDRLEQGQEDIKLRLGNTAFQFDVDELKKRVRKIELKVGIRKA